MQELYQTLKNKGWEGKCNSYQDVIERYELIRRRSEAKISVIVISWRLVKETKLNFETLEKQRKEQFELIFVNNGGSDQEFEAILPYVDKYIKLNKNTGAYKARNIGSVFAESPLLLFLEDDGIPNITFIKSHLEAFEKFDILCLRGVYKPLSNSVYNKLASHYYLGEDPFPALFNLEGNASVLASCFFEIGGWDDEIKFGHGGPEFALRLFKKYPDFRKQIYYPKAIINHDYVKSKEHLQIKAQRQNASLLRLKDKHADWDEFVNSWYQYRKKSYLLIRKNPTIKDKCSDMLNFLIERIVTDILRIVKHQLKK
ncbi:glycosyltransferase family 2 protein [Sabulibacter ruber]|uniref:glycosyltransferase family 2 protein n=1 Tax=Sabulibacter ruber TaxID=2811901 RepID=UPI001A9666CB|nr:glycosyltransferase [Sabulibacter ruber]